MCVSDGLYMRGLRRHTVGPLCLSDTLVDESIEVVVCASNTGKGEKRSDDLHDER
jgi:hypothetical protein